MDPAPANTPLTQENRSDILLAGTQILLTRQHPSPNTKGMPLSMPFPQYHMLQAAQPFDNPDPCPSQHPLTSTALQQQQHQLQPEMCIDQQVQMQIKQLQQQIAITQEQLIITSGGLNTSEGACSSSNTAPMQPALSQPQLSNSANPPQCLHQHGTQSIPQGGSYASPALSTDTAAAATISVPCHENSKPAVDRGQARGMESEKECTGCHETKPSSDFCRNPSSPDGLRSKCRGCIKIHREKLAEAKPTSQRKRCQVGSFSVFSFFFSLVLTVGFPGQKC